MSDLSIGSSSRIIQNALNKAQQSINISSERLSTGSKINNAKDNPVDFAASIQLDSQIRGLNQSIKNANDAISLFQTAEFGLSEINQLLQQVKELSIQASSETVSNDDRSKMQVQANQLLDQMNQVVSSTQFNGKNLLDGQLGALQFQLIPGRSVNATIHSATTKAFNLTPNVLGDMSSGRISSNLEFAKEISGGDLILNGHVLPGSNFLNVVSNYSSLVNGYTIKNVAAAVAGYINESSDVTGVLATAYNFYKGDVINGVTNDGLLINGVSFSSSENLSQLVNKINNNDELSAMKIKALLNSDGSISLSNITGQNIVISGDTTNTGLTTGTYTGYVSLSEEKAGEITWSLGEGNISFLNKIGFSISNGADKLIAKGMSVNGDFSSGDVIINGVDIFENGASDLTLSGKAEEINKKKNLTGVLATSLQEKTYTFTDNTGVTNSKLLINTIDVTLNDGDDLDALISSINNNHALNVTASKNREGRLVLSSDSEIEVDFELINGQAGADPEESVLTDGDSVSSLSLSSIDGSPIRLEGDGLDKIGFVSVGGPAKSDADNLNLNITTSVNANNAIKLLDAAIASAQESLNNMTSLQSSFQSSINFIENNLERLSTARSSITDVDFAAETAALTRAQILQEAGLAILAQANARMQSVLALLK